MTTMVDSAAIGISAAAASHAVATIITVVPAVSASAGKVTRKRA